MALVPYTVTALAQSDAEGTNGKNIVEGATVMLKNIAGQVVEISDDEFGLNPSTSKFTGSNGQVVIYAEPGKYTLEVNGSQSKVNIGSTLLIDDQEFKGENNFTGGLKKDGEDVLTQAEADLLYTSADIKTEENEWTALNNFTGGLQKNGVDLDDLYFNFLGANGNPDDYINQDGYVSGRPFAENHPPLVHGTMLNYGRSTSGDIQIFVDDNGWMATRANSWTGVWSDWNPVAYTNKSQTYTGNNTFTGSNNFTGDLLKNGSPVIGLEDLTYNSDESLAIASTTIEQFYKDQEAGLYDDFDSGVGSLAAGFVNSIINQANFLIANNGNIDKLKSSAIEVSGSGYALNQNPTWQDTLDGWEYTSRVEPQTIKISGGTKRFANNMLIINTNQNDGVFNSDDIPCDPEETYTVKLHILQEGTANQYLYINFKDKDGNNITSTESDATGWANIGSFHYFGLLNQPALTSNWSKHEVKIGLNGDMTVPSLAKFMVIGIRANFSGDFANTTVYLQDYRIEKAMGSVSIENGSINADHLVLSGNGSITFDTVGADQAGSALTAETNAKAYAFPQANAGALASLNTISGTYIDNDSITTPKIATNAVTANEIASNAVTTNKLSSNAVTADKISSDVAVINKLTANKVFGVDATFAGTVYARNLTGDANEYGIADMGDQTITGNGVWNNIAQVKVEGDSYLKRELIVEPFRVDDGSGCSFELRVQTQPIQSGGVAVATKTFLTNGISGNNIETRQAKIIIENDGLDYWVTVRAKNNVSSITPVTSGSITFRTRPISGTLAIDIL